MASPIDTTNLMRDVLIALVPAMVMGVVFFGPRALVATIISVLACEFFEWGYRKLMHKSCAVKDLSAAVTGVLLAFRVRPHPALLDADHRRLLRHRGGQAALRRPG